MAEILVASSRGMANKYRRMLETSPSEPVSILTWPDLLRELATQLDLENRRLLSLGELSLLVMKACLTLQPQLKYYQNIADQRGFWSGMTRFIQEIRSRNHPWQNQIADSAKAADIELILIEYLSLLESTGSIDTPGRFRLLTETVLKAKEQGQALFCPETQIRVIGEQKLTGVQEKLLESLSAHGVSWGIQTVQSPNGNRPCLSQWSAADPIGEVRHLVQRVQSLIEDGSPLSQIAVIYPQDQYLNLLQKEFGRKGVPIRDFAHKSLASIPLVSRIMKAFLVSDTTQMTVREQFCALEENTSKMINPGLWDEELPEHHFEDRRRLAAQEVRAVDKLLEVASRTSEVLALIYEDRPLSCQEFGMALGLMVGGEFLWENPLPTPGLKCLPLSQAAGVRGDHLFFIGLNQAVFGKRREGWLPKLAEQEELSEVIDMLIAEGPASVTLSYCATDPGGSLQLKPLYFSKLAAAGWELEPEEIPYHRPSQELSDLEYTAKIKSKLKMEKERSSKAFTCYDGNLADLAPNQLSKNGELGFSLSQLESYLRCPFGYFAQYLLGLKSTDQELPEVQPIDQGALIHQVLQGFYSQVSTPLDPDLTREYQNLLSELLSQEIGRRKAISDEVLPGAWQITQLRLTNFLKGVLLEELRQCTQPDSLCPVKLEESITKVKLSTSFGQVELSGRIDRIDTDGAGNWLLIDYKSSPVTIKDISGCNRLQLPIYAQAWLEQLLEQGEEVNSIAVSYYSYQKAQRCTYLPKDLQETEEWLERAVQTAVQATEELLSGKFIPLPQDEKVCDHCDFADLCRVPGGLTDKELTRERGEVGA